MRCKRCKKGKLYFISNIIKESGTYTVGDIIGSAYLCDYCGKGVIIKKNEKTNKKFA